MRPKYFAKKITNLHGTWDSKNEYLYYLHLLERQERGEIYGLRKQVSVEIVPKRVVEIVKRLKTKDKVVKRVDEQRAVYTCDFVYYDNGLHSYVMVEYKSPMTAKLPDYILRRKLIKQVIDRHNRCRGCSGRWAFAEVVMGKKNK